MRACPAAAAAAALQCPCSLLSPEQLPLPLTLAPHSSYETRQRSLQPGYEVTLIGYRGAALIEELQAPCADGRLTLAYLPDL